MSIIIPRILRKFEFTCIYLKSHIVKQTRKKNDIPFHHQRRMEKIGTMLREMRFAEGLNQDEFIGVSRKQIQRGEYGSNLSLISLYKLLDAYGYRLDEFFEGME